MFVHLPEARRLVAQVRLDLSNASDASDRAVLADSDEQAVSFARQAQRAADAVRAALPTLGEHLAALRGGEGELLAQFQERFDRYRRLEGEILALAGANSNLKAQQLSFGPVRQTADAFRGALDRAADASPAPARSRARDLAARAELAVREIQILQAPHIAESQDAEMDRLEKEMAAREATARGALEALGPLAGAAGQHQVEQARAALDRFQNLSRQLVGLSRRNTNVRALELALRHKPALSAACDESLAALEAALAREGFSGTR